MIVRQVNSFLFNHTGLSEGAGGLIKKKQDPEIRKRGCIV